MWQGLGASEQRGGSQNFFQFLNFQLFIKRIRFLIQLQRNSTLSNPTVCGHFLPTLILLNTLKQHIIPEQVLSGTYNFCYLVISRVWEIDPKNTCIFTAVIYSIIHHVEWLFVFNNCIPCILLHTYLVNNTVTKLISAQ